MVTVTTRHKTTQYHVLTGGLATDPSYQILVLVDGETGSAAEAVAAALSNGGALYLTTGRWKTREGRAIDDGGIVLDYGGETFMWPNSIDLVAKGAVALARFEGLIDD